MTVLFPPEQAGPVLGWTSAVAAYGAAVLPALENIKTRQNLYYPFSRLEESGDSLLDMPNSMNLTG